MAMQIKSNGNGSRWGVIAVLVGIGFFGSYAFAQAKGSGVTGGGLVTAAATATGAATGASAPSGSGGGGCCGSGVAAPAEAQVPKTAELVGGVQKISVDVSKGYYDPSTIELKAGVPAEVTFSQASGCTGSVQSQDLGFSEDLSAGPKTVKLPALTAGTYSFACGMDMVSGSIVVK